MVNDMKIIYSPICAGQLLYINFLPSVINKHQLKGKRWAIALSCSVERSSVVQVVPITSSQKNIFGKILINGFVYKQLATNSYLCFDEIITIEKKHILSKQIDCHDHRLFFNFMIDKYLQYLWKIKNNSCFIQKPITKT